MVVFEKGNLPLKELAQKLMQVEGECRGAIFKTDANFVLREKGEAGLKKVEAKLNSIGISIDYQKINSFGFYPLGLRAISLLAIKEVFGWGEEKIEKMGREAPKFSLILKFFIKYFLSLSQAAKQVPKMWKKHYTRGDLEVIELNEKEKRVILRLKGLDLHPIFCRYLGGYFASVTQLIVGTVVSSEEKSCPFKGDEYHEYFLKW